MSALMIRCAILALLLTVAPALAQTPNPGRPSWPSIIIGGSPISGVGTAPGTVAAGNDSRITGALQPGGTGDVSGMSGKATGGSAARFIADWTADLAALTTIPTRASITGKTILSSVSRLPIGGYASPGDGCRSAMVRGSSAGPAAIQDALGGWWQLEDDPAGVNVVCFGASRTQVSDAAPAIQAAATYAATGPFRRLRFPSGYYQMGSGVTIMNGLTIEGDGILATELRPTGSFDLFAATDTLGVTLRDITAKIYGFTPTAGSLLKVAPASGQNSLTRVDNVQTYALYHGIDFEAASNWSVFRSTFGSSVSYDIVARNTAAPDHGDSTIEANLFNGSSVTPSAIYWTSGGGLRIVNNKFLGYVDPFKMVQDAGASTVILHAQNNSLENFSGSAFNLGQSASSTGDTFQHVNISGNQIGLYQANARAVTVNAGSRADWLQWFSFYGNQVRITASGAIGVNLTAGKIGRISDNIFVADASVSDATAVSIGANASYIDAGHNTLNNIATRYSNASTTSNIILLAQSGTTNVTVGTAYAAGYRGDSTNVLLPRSCSGGVQVVASAAIDPNTGAISASGTSFQYNGSTYVTLHAYAMVNGATVPVSWIASCY